MMRKLIILWLTGLAVAVVGMAFAQQWIPNPNPNQSSDPYQSSGTNQMGSGSGYYAQPVQQQSSGSGYYQPSGSEYATGAPAPSGSNELFNTLNNLLGTVDKGMDLWKKGRDIKKGEYYGDPGYGSSGYTDTYWGDSGSSGYTDPYWGGSGSSGYTDPSWGSSGSSGYSYPSWGGSQPILGPGMLPNIGGTWQGAGGPYYISQNGASFTWVGGDGKTRGSGSIMGNNLTTQYTMPGRPNPLQVTGTIIQSDGNYARRIQWSHGITLTR